MTTVEAAPSLLPMTARFLTRAQAAEQLNIGMAQCYALIRRGELRAAKIGGRCDYRIGQGNTISRRTSSGPTRRPNGGWVSISPARGNLRSADICLAVCRLQFC